MVSKIRFVVFLTVCLVSCSPTTVKLITTDSGTTAYLKTKEGLEVFITPISQVEGRLSLSVLNSSSNTIFYFRDVTYNVPCTSEVPTQFKIGVDNGSLDQYVYLSTILPGETVDYDFFACKGDYVNIYFRFLTPQILRSSDFFVENGKKYVRQSDIRISGIEYTIKLSPPTTGNSGVAYIRSSGR